jgi:hypothetical protein
MKQYLPSLSKPRTMAGGLELPSLFSCQEHNAAWNPTYQRFCLQEDLWDARKPRLPDQFAECDPRAGVANRRCYLGKSV